MRSLIAFALMTFMGPNLWSADALDIDATGKATFSADVDVDGAFKIGSGAAITEISTDAALTAGSDAKVPTEKAVKTYADTIKTEAIAYMDSQVAAQGMYGFSGTRSSAFDLNASWKTIAYNEEEFDDGNAYNASTGVWTCPESGRYFFAAAVRCHLGTGQGRLQIQINKNGVAQRLTEVEADSSTAVITATVQGYFALLAGDEMRIKGVSTSGTRGIYQQSYSNYLTIIQKSKD